MSLSSSRVSLINISNLKSSYTPSSNVNCFPSNETLISSSIRFPSLLNKATITLFGSRSCLVMLIVILRSSSKYITILVYLVYSLNLISCFPVYLISPNALIRRFTNNLVSSKVWRFRSFSVTGIRILFFFLGLYFRSTSKYSSIFLMRSKSICVLPFKRMSRSRFRTGSLARIFNLTRFSVVS
jgi:hypothetical protein